ncbi:DUF2306 domain-containing protein [Oxalobacteraceae bacterium OM1]|nr:DUF2306 domain-containing protein [Oxalobacteraceae bacterium OM1]
MQATPVVVIHVAAAVAALAIGAAAFSAKKGSLRHRLLGRSWAMLMLLAALTSLGIRTTGHFSWIHILSVVVLTTIPLAVFAAMRGRIHVHRRAMSANYAGLVIAGFFSLMPARLLGQLLWN